MMTSATITPGVLLSNVQAEACRSCQRNTWIYDTRVISFRWTKGNRPLNFVTTLWNVKKVIFLRDFIPFQHLKNAFKTSFVRYGCLKDVLKTSSTKVWNCVRTRRLLDIKAAMRWLINRPSKHMPVIVTLHSIAVIKLREHY